MIGNGLSPRSHLKQARSKKALEECLEVAGLQPEDIERLEIISAEETESSYNSNIENYIGIARVPIGLAGPVLVNGQYAKGRFLVPMATSEAALVASYNRGMSAITAAGGAVTTSRNCGVIRTPAFLFKTPEDARQFSIWVEGRKGDLEKLTGNFTRHGKLISLSTVVDHNVAFVLFRYDTSEAAGQNMVTVITDGLMEIISSECPIRIERSYIESNCSGDKKSTGLGYISGRGRHATASVDLDEAVLRDVLSTSVDEVATYGEVAQLGSMLAMQVGSQGHFANALAAIYLATGQDIACVSESSIGITRITRIDSGVRVTVTVPNIMVGTVGGGTSMPTPAICHKIIGADSARALSEVIAATCLAGEVSIMSAIASGQFARAHRILSRHR